MESKYCKNYRLSEKGKESLKRRTARYIASGKSAEKVKRWRMNNIEKVRAKEKSSKLKDPIRFMLSILKYRAKKKGWEFNLDREDIIIPDICPVLGIPLIISTGKHSNNSPSVDRMDHTKGYIKGNVKVISFRANTLKSNATEDELLKVIKYVKECVQYQ